jgi:hypothetical protein
MSAITSTRKLFGQSAANRGRVAGSAGETMGQPLALDARSLVSWLNRVHASVRAFLYYMTPVMASRAGGQEFHGCCFPYKYDDLH